MFIRPEMKAVSIEEVRELVFQRELDTDGDAPVVSGRSRKSRF